MTNISLNLPKSLYEQLQQEAAYEDLPLDQYIIYALTRQSTIPYLYKVPRQDLAKQREEFEAVLARLPKASEEEIQRLLDERELAPPDKRVDVETKRRFEAMLAELAETPYTTDD